MGNQLKLRHTDLQGRVGDAREQITLLDVENTKITNRCEVLHQLNLSLEEDRKSLMSQVSLLLSQYHDLLTQTLDDKEHYHEEEREYSEIVHSLTVLPLFFMIMFFAIQSLSQQIMIL